MDPSSPKLVGTGLFFVLSALVGIIFVGDGYKEIDLLSRVLLGGGGIVLLAIGIVENNWVQLRVMLKKRATKAFVIAAIIVLLGFFFYGAVMGNLKNVTEDIPFTASWKAQGPGAINLHEENGALTLSVDLKGGDDYAEIFLDLRSVHFTNIEQNTDGICNMVGKRLDATIRSSPDFRGDLDHLNGVQFILRDKQYNMSVGPWFDIGPTILTGMKIFYVVPENQITRETAAISLKFTIGSGSNESFKGELFLNRMTVNSEMRSNWLYSLLFIVPSVFAIAVFVLMVKYQKQKDISKIRRSKKSRRGKSTLQPN
jgi:hypothetical protein